MIFELLRFLPRRWWRIRYWKAWIEYIKWRLITVGCYYPDDKFHWDIFYNYVLKRLPAYCRWLKRMKYYDRLNK